MARSMKGWKIVWDGDLSILIYAQLVTVDQDYPNFICINGSVMVDMGSTVKNIVRCEVENGQITSLLSNGS